MADTSRATGRGLKQLGNTCYFNSTIQCLAKTKPLRKGLRSLLDSTQDSNTTSFNALSAAPLTNELRNTMKSISVSPSLSTSISSTIETASERVEKGHTSSRGGNGTKSNRKAIKSSGGAFDPTALLSKLRKVSPQFKGNSQQDAHECLISILSECHEELVKSKKRHMKEIKAQNSLQDTDNDDEVDDDGDDEDEDDDVSDDTSSIISDTFGFTLWNIFQCSQCSYQFLNEEQTMILSLNIPGCQNTAMEGSKRNKSYNRFLVNKTSGAGATKKAKKIQERAEKLKKKQQAELALLAESEWLESLNASSGKKKKGKSINIVTKNKSSKKLKQDEKASKRLQKLASRKGLSVAQLSNQNGKVDAVTDVETIAKNDVVFESETPQVCEGSNLVLCQNAPASTLICEKENKLKEEYDIEKAELEEVLEKKEEEVKEEEGDAGESLNKESSGNAELRKEDQETMEIKEIMKQNMNEEVCEPHRGDASCDHMVNMVLNEIIDDVVSLSLVKSINLTTNDQPLVSMHSMHDVETNDNDKVSKPDEEVVKEAMKEKVIANLIEEGWLKLDDNEKLRRNKLLQSSFGQLSTRLGDGLGSSTTAVNGKLSVAACLSDMVKPDKLEAAQGNGIYCPCCEAKQAKSDKLARNFKSEEEQLSTSNSSLLSPSLIEDYVEADEVEVSVEDDDKHRSKVVVDATHRIVIADPPKVLLLHFIRLLPSGKLDHHIEAPDVLNLSPFCVNRSGNSNESSSGTNKDEPSYEITYDKDNVINIDEEVTAASNQNSSSDEQVHGDILYDLFAFIEHIGGSRAGHYVAYTQTNIDEAVPPSSSTPPKATDVVNKNSVLEKKKKVEEEQEEQEASFLRKKWNRISDSSVDDEATEAAKEAKVYILFYARRD